MHYLYIFIVSLMRRLFFKKVVWGNKYTFYIWVFFRNLWVLPVLFNLFRFVTKQFCLFRLFRYRFKTPKQTDFLFCFTKQTEKNAKQILFRFVSVRTENYFCLFRGHPTPIPPLLSSPIPSTHEVLIYSVLPHQ